jgi:hypothetical protein
VILSRIKEFEKYEVIKDDYEFRNRIRIDDAVQRLSADAA